MGRVNLSRKALFGDDGDSPNTQPTSRAPLSDGDRGRPRPTGGPQGGRGRFNDRGRRPGPGPSSNSPGPRGNGGGSPDRRFPGGGGSNSG